MKRKTKIILVGCAAAAALAVYFLQPANNEDQTTPTFTVAEGPLTIGITSSGSIQSRDKITLRSELEGNNTIIWVVDEGVNVKAGDLLLEFDSAALVTKRNDQEINDILRLSRTGVAEIPQPLCTGPLTVQFAGCPFHR